MSRVTCHLSVSLDGFIGGPDQSLDYPVGVGGGLAWLVGDDPPYHGPVFVLTNHEHDSIEMSGGTTFHFVTGGFQAGLDRAKEAAGDRDVRIAGGASTVRQALAANAIDDIWFDIIPVALGSGETIFEGPPSSTFTQLEVTHSTTYAHLHYRVG